jgi:hypothetical protein
MSRSWFVSPVRIRPNDPVPGRYEPSYFDYVGPDPSVMEKVRGPFDTCAVAVAAARVWREVEGKHSDLWLVLVEDGYATHCTRYDPDRKPLPRLHESLDPSMRGANGHVHKYGRDGKCRYCPATCAHPTHYERTYGRICLTCGRFEAILPTPEAPVP